MQTIQITLSDSLLEQAVLRLAKEQHQNLQEFAMTALNYYVREAEKTEDLELNALVDSRLNDGQALIKVSLDEL
jgi:hypothetical protein